MVNQYVWPDIDPERWRDDNEQVVDYLARRISELEEELTELRKQSVKVFSDSESLAYFRKKDAKRRELFTLRIRYMRHSFLSSVSKGVKAFLEVYETATDSYDYSLRDSIIDYVQQFEDEFNVQQRYEVKLKQAGHLVDLGEYETANEVYTDLLEVTRGEPHRRVPVLIGRGNTHIRQGKTQKAISDFETAVEVSQEENLGDWLINSKLALGWAYRRASQLVKAAEVYNKALSLCRAKNELELEANLLKSLGYVKALQRYQQAAVALCHQAIEIWEDLRQQGKGSPRDLGMVYSTLGEVYSEGGQLEKSLEHFNDALRIFESTEDREWQSIALCGRGRAYWMMGMEYEDSKDTKEVLEAAQKDLEKALRIAPVMEKARILARLGWVYYDKGDLEQAESAFSESYNIALQTGEPVYELYSLAGLIKVAYQRRRGDHWREFEKQFQEFESRWEHPDKYMEPLVGYFFKSLADLAVLNDDCEKSIDFYIHSFKAWATRSMFQSYSLNRQLEVVDDEVIPYLPSDRVQELGQRLLDVWARNEKFTNEHPEVITYFSRWARRKG
jgi:tetratricopeptide (TPR) repeat protein